MKNVFMIFTEGPHDVAFINKVLHICCGAIEKKSIKLSEFPQPFASIFRENVNRYAMQDLSLDMIQKFFLPDKVLEKENCFIMIFNTGGKNNNSEKVKELMNNVLFNLKYKKDIIQEIKEIKYLFINDADDNTGKKVIENMKSTFFPIINIDTQETFLECSSPDVFFYVWPNQNNSGTLEDILIELAKISEPDIISNTFNYIVNTFTEYKEVGEIPQKAKQLKSIITCAGQGRSPGASLNSIINNGYLIKKDFFKKNQDVIGFTCFLNQILDSITQI